MDRSHLTRRSSHGESGCCVPTRNVLLRWPFGHPDLGPFRGYYQPESTSGAIMARFLGTSSVLFQDGDTAIMSDGFVTRPSLRKVLFGRIAPDRARVERTLHTLDTRQITAVFCNHSHYDHALDAPLIVQMTGAQLVGAESTLNLGRGMGLAEAQMRAVRDGDTVRYGKFHLTFIESVHSPGDRSPGRVDAPLVPPARADAWKSGTTWSVLIEREGRRVLMHASANYKPGALRGYRAETVYLGIGTLGKQGNTFVDAYWDEVVHATGARRVILVHWDDFFRTLDEPLRPTPYALDSFPDGMAQILRCAAQDRVEVLLPVPWRETDPFAGLP